MRIVTIIASACLCIGGCSRPDGRALDGLVSSNRIDRVEIVENDEGRTNILSGEGAARLLSRFAATNRLTNPVRGKSYVSGHITLIAQGQPVGHLAYFPREQVFSYHNYEFSLRDTNDLAALFR